MSAVSLSSTSSPNFLSLEKLAKFSILGKRVETIHLLTEGLPSEAVAKEGASWCHVPSVTDLPTIRITPLDG